MRRRSSRASRGPASGAAGRPWSGGCTGAANPCVFTIGSDTTLTASFSLLPSNIVATAGANGSITPSGTISVASGASQAFTLTPATGFQVADVLVDGVSVGAVSSYTFLNVTSPGYGTPRFRVVASVGWTPGEALTALEEAPVPVESPLPLVPAPAVVSAPAPVVEPAAPPAANVVAAQTPVAPPEPRKLEAMATSLNALDEVAQAMKADESIHTLRVEAHTDNAASAAYNLKLSSARADWVRGYLIKKGVAAGRLEAQGFGTQRPIQTNLTPAGRSANRRVEFVIRD